MHFLPVVYHSNSPPGKVLAIALFAILCPGLYLLSILESPGLTESVVKGVQNPTPHLLSWATLESSTAGWVSQEADSETETRM